MKRTYTVALTIITIICIILGTAVHVGGFAGKFPVPFFPFGGAMFDPGMEIRTDESFDNVSSLLIEADLMNITVRSGEGSSAQITYEGGEKLKPAAVMKGGTLEITQKQKIKPGLKDVKARLTVTLPKGSSLIDFDLDLDVGNIDLKDITAEDMDLNVDVGNVEGTNISSESIAVDTDTGNILFNNAAFTGINAASDVGNIEIDSAKNLSGYGFSCKTDLGNIVINGDKVSKNFERAGNDGNVNLGSDVGNIIIKY